MAHIDSDGNRFWNATDACCNFDRAAVDDVAYLTDVIAEIQAELAIDPKRIALVGHSNGGFMSYRMACEQADLVSAIVSLAGATFADPADCAPSEPVSVVQIHGTADDVILYEGGGPFTDATGPYPGAETTAEIWATYDGCGETSSPLSAKVDVDVRPRGRSRPGRDVGHGVVRMRVGSDGTALDDPGRRPRPGALAGVRRLSHGLPGRPSEAVGRGY